MSDTRHVNVMRESSADELALGQAVEDRFLDLSASWVRIRGVEIPVPQSLFPDMTRWREMRLRHRSGDFRITEAESRSTKTIAQWTLDMNAVLRNQVPQKLACLET